MSLSLIYQNETLKPRIAAVLGEFRLAFHVAERSPYPMGLNEKLHVVYSLPEDQRRRGVAIEIGLDSMDATMERLRTEIGKLHPDRVPKPKPADAPRVTPTDVEAEIESEFYFTGAQAAHAGLRESDPSEVEMAAIRGPLRLLTFCVLVLRNGFTVTGESACASPENFDAEIGRKIARQNAVTKIWPLLGFRLRDKLASKQPTEWKGEPLATHARRRPDPRNRS